MESPKGAAIEHPFVSRVKNMYNRPCSPSITVRDAIQPSHGYLRKISHSQSIIKTTLEHQKCIVNDIGYTK